MLITQNLSLVRILRSTWKVDLMMIFTCVATYYLHEYIVSRAIQIPATLATLLGTAIAFFVGFNNNQAYSRWWEARTIWGAIVNDSRSWTRNILYYTVPGELTIDELAALKKRIIFRQIAFIYALKESLRRNAEGYYKQFLSETDLEQVNKESNTANAILSLHAIDLQQLSQAHAIDEFRFVQFNTLISALTDHMGRSERIRNTVFPTSYIYFTRLFIWAFVIFLTLILADAVGGWSIVIGWIIGFIFHVTHQNGMGLMDPFDEISTGIPLNQICRTIEINLLQMLGEKDIPPPVQPINQEYYL
ncbi:bestrophin family ion channel [Rhodocytophaga aerolata]|uniref:Bestrophin family ion channel n=1 Tax=Rhodocytophaga aerolata TaxID=455078 RepID=A0ABT8RF25_9BACT|nr:bestrophin family ion channel [Rhodocytophaga aerolata]MDO1449322.1 bestrophin family ion channel [Rhodocytophaga aerolata]